MGRNEYDKKKGVNMRKEQKDIENDIYGSYETSRRVKANVADMFKNIARDPSLSPGAKDLAQRETAAYQGQSEDIGERQRRMNSIKKR